MVLDSGTWLVSIDIAELMKIMNDSTLVTLPMCFTYLFRTAVWLSLPCTLFVAPTSVWSTAIIFDQRIWTPLRNVFSPVHFQIVVNQAVEKFRFWLLEHYRSFQNDLVDLFTSQKGNNSVCASKSVKRRKPPSKSPSICARREGMPRKSPFLNSTRTTTSKSSRSFWRSRPSPIRSSLDWKKCIVHLPLHRRNISPTPIWNSTPSRCWKEF